MSKLPPAYRRDAAKIASVAENLVKSGRGNGNMIPGARDLATRLRAFLSRWQNQPAVASHEDLLTRFRNQLLRTERHIEALHIATLAELLDYRKCQINAHHLLESYREIADFMQVATPDELAEIQRALKEAQHEDFHAASTIAKQTAEVARQDADHDRLIDEYERHWPDRLDDLHYVAILNLELEQHPALVEELHLMKSALA